MYGGTQRQLLDGSYAFDFPSTKQAANALALVYAARQLTQEYKESLAIVNEFIKGDQAVALFGFDPAQEPERLAAMDRFTARKLLSKARVQMFELGISPSHRRNKARLDVVAESLPAQYFEEVFGFDPVLEPHLLDELKNDPIATAKAVIAGEPILREQGVNLNAELKLREEVINGRKLLAEQNLSFAETALKRENIQREIGGYVDDEKERLAADDQQLSGGEERLAVLKTAREVLALEGLQAMEIEFNPGDWVQGKIVAYNRPVKEIGADEYVPDLDRAYVGITVESKTSSRENTWSKAPVGTAITATPDRLVLSRPDGTSTSFQVENVN
jgi:hypothetical protein